MSGRGPLYACAGVARSFATANWLGATMIVLGLGLFFPSATKASHRAQLGLGHRDPAVATDAARALQSEVTGTITTDGTPVTKTISTPGDTITLTFYDYPGNSVSLKMSGTLAAYSIVRILGQPDQNGNTPTIATAQFRNEFVDKTLLPSDHGPVGGIYKITITPPSNQPTGTGTFRLWDVPADNPGTMTIGGAAETMTISTPGQNAYRTFEGEEGQLIFVKFSGSFVYYDSVKVCRGVGFCQDPTKVVASTTFGAGYVADRVSLPARDTYTIYLDPWGPMGETGNATFQIYPVPPDESGTIAVNGSSQVMAVSNYGRRSERLFAGFPGQQVKLSWQNVSMYYYAAIHILDPNGTSIGALTIYGGGTLSRTLSMQGTYKVWLDPPGTFTGNINVTLTGTPGGAMRIVGLADVGETLFAQASFPTPPADEPPTYQWQRCDPMGASCTSPNETTPSYVVRPEDLGQTVRVEVTARNAQGATTLRSTAVRILDTVQSVALRFRPYLLFDLGERWRPLDVPYFLDELLDDGTDHRLCDPAGNCLHSPALSDLASPYKVLDINGTTGNASSFQTPSHLCYKAPGGQDCDKGSYSAIYYEPTRDPALGYLYLDYWFFYRYNDDPIFPEGNHEGDWEGLTVVVDPTGPPNNTGGPVASYVLYATHDENTWSAYLGAPETTHAEGYVAQGTHATYPDPCRPAYGDYCGPFEVSYDGLSPWGRNDETECATNCAIRFENIDGGAWASWDGTWGIDGFFGPGGDSPSSPGQQGRFVCARGGLYGSYAGCPTPPFAGIPAGPLASAWKTSSQSTTQPARSPTVGGPAGAAAICRSWEGTSAALAICQPSLLRRAIRSGNISSRIRPNVRIPGFRGRVTAAPGVTQAIGQPLRAGQVALVRGPLEAGTELVVRIREKNHRWVALFKLPHLQKEARPTVRVSHGGSHPVVALRLDKDDRWLRPRYFAPER